MMKRGIKEEVCVVCGRIFEKALKKRGSKGAKSKPKRGYSVKTCSSKCSTKLARTSRSKYMKTYRKKE